MWQSFTKWLGYTLTNTQTRLVLFLTVSVCVLILTVSLTSYFSSKSVLQKELSEPQQQLLQISMNFIDEYIDKSNQIAIAVSLHPNIYNFLTAENQSSYRNISEIYTFMSTLIENTSYIESIYVHDLERGSFVSMPQGYSASSLTFADSAWIGVAEEFGDRKMLVRDRSVPSGSGFRGNGSEITLFRKILIQGQFKGIVAINLKEEEIFAKLHPPQRTGLDRTRFIVDTDGGILYTVPGGGLDGEGIQAMAELAVMSEPGSHGNEYGSEPGDFLYQDRSFLVNRLDSPLTGWKYISAVSQESLLAQSKSIRNAVLSISAAALLVGVLAIMYIQTLTFRPIRRIQQLFRKNESELPGTDLHHLERLTTELLSDHAQLSQLIRQTMPEVSSKFLYDIYVGNRSGIRSIRDKWSSCFQDWSSEPVLIAVVSIDQFECWSRRYSGTDRSLLKFALANIITEVLSPAWRSECSDFGKDKLGIVLQLKSGDEPGEPYLQKAADVVDRMLGFSISMGISAVHADAGELKQAMLEADNALGYRLYRGKGSIVFFREVADHEPGEKSEGTEADWAGELAAAVESGDETRVLNLVVDLGEELRTENDYPSRVILKLRPIQERLHRIGLREAVELEREEEPLEELHTLTLEDILKDFSHEAVQLARRFNSLMESKEFVQCRKMIEFMKQHLAEPVGIQEIADSAGISVSLASQLFKQEINDTIYGYFTKLRMDRAEELLVDSDDRISDIAGRVGYVHENSFIRVFRKYKNITPGKYREMMKYRSGPDQESQEHIGITEWKEMNDAKPHEIEPKANRIAP
ncbi:AraC family transcriptional regulator [Paenibacillus lemnae]|uniref:AraC family transcriptional regulator n=1 Tax=Paenibacillus lemnae TaxID=1330551 RepID=A0A848M228_PAELE|nr:AraC family transcriptional regulator [Paenibacillus lemnae]NMO95028.1 AraC family transcriptional regulator [Paenibacillus lemnae]